ncbi:unnamed protein product, partial [Ectocarpus sp. 6 AP-2014]
TILLRGHHFVVFRSWVAPGTGRPHPIPSRPVSHVLGRWWRAHHTHTRALRGGLWKDKTVPSYTHHSLLPFSLSWTVQPKRRSNDAVALRKKRHIARAPRVPHQSFLTRSLLPVRSP